MSIKNYIHKQSFVLESGRVLPELNIAYHTYGTLNATKDNVIWICHALTANSDAEDWWPNVVGKGYLINPETHFIVCANVVGSHYGTTGPLSSHPDLGRPYGLLFPEITVKDMVKAHQLLASHLELGKIALLIGASIGGQQAVEWATTEPERFEKLLLIATNAFHSPWGIAFNEAQRLALQSDRTFFSDSADGGKKGLKAARAIALLSYRNAYTYNHSQQENDKEKTGNYKAASYQQYQGEKLVNRFNAYSYYFLSKAMDSHHVGRGRTSAENALSTIQSKTLVIGISSDLLFPTEEQKFLAKHIPNAEYIEIDSFYGHDGFLLEHQLLTEIVHPFLQINKLSAITT